MPMAQMQRSPQPRAERTESYATIDDEISFEDAVARLRRLTRPETAQQRRARQKAERQQLAQEKLAQEAERQRLAREHDRLVQAQYSLVREKWISFQKVKHDAPPTLLPLEASGQMDNFGVFLKQETRNLEQAAIDRFETEIRSQSREAEKAVAQLRDDISFKAIIAGRLKPFGHFAKVRELLGKCVLSTNPPELGSPAREAVAHASRFLRTTWSTRLSQKRQAIFAVHRNAGKIIMHLGSSVFGSVFITVPHSLDPEALAAALLKEIKGASSTLIAPDSTVAVIDGDHQGLNYQKILDSQIVVRSMVDDCDQFASNLNVLLEREPPTADNTALHFGVPAAAAELNAVFPSGGADWSGMWRGVAQLWRDRATRQGFDSPTSATAEAVLESLTTHENVIVVIAHADRRTLHMPAPPPKGSKLSTDDIIAHKDDIRKNRPVVYLFCCETAEISNLNSFSETLLECGAAAVIAPQAKIDAERSVDFFEAVVDRNASPGQDSLAKLKAAESRSKYREMEAWLG
jgi:hypothetical protein